MEFDDLISRAATIDAVENLASSMSVCINVDEYNGMRDMKYRALKAIKECPSAQPDLDSAYTEGYTAAESKYRKMWDEMQAAQQWIPCKTRLPAPCTDVIVTDVDGDVEIASLEYDWDDRLVWWLIDYGQLEVLAWKPLPDPWKGEQHE